MVASSSRLAEPLVLSLLPPAGTTRSINANQTSMPSPVGEEEDEDDPSFGGRDADN